jgi:hypothetical protein
MQAAAKIRQFAATLPCHANTWFPVVPLKKREKKKKKGDATHDVKFRRQSFPCLDSRGTETPESGLLVSLLPAPRI